MDFPFLSSLILLPLIGALFIFFSKSKSNTYITIKYLALFVSFANFILSLYLWYLFDPSNADFQFLEEQSWIKGFINYKVGIDGISILFIILTAFIAPLCIVSVKRFPCCNTSYGIFNDRCFLLIRLSYFLSFF